MHVDGGNETILIAGQARLMRECLASLIQSRWASVTVREAGCSDALFAHLAQCNTDLVIGLVGSSSEINHDLETVARRELRPKLMICYGPPQSTESIARLRQIDADAYVTPSMSLDSFLDVISLVMHNERFVPSEMLLRLAGEPPTSPADLTNRPELTAALTHQEYRLLEFLVAGQSNKIIAHLLGASESTVKLYLRRLFQKLNVQNRTQAATAALERRLVDPNGFEPRPLGN